MIILLSRADEYLFLKGLYQTSAFNYLIDSGSFKSSARINAIHPSMRRLAYQELETHHYIGETLESIVLENTRKAFLGMAVYLRVTPLQFDDLFRRLFVVVGSVADGGVGEDENEDGVKCV